VSPAAHVLFAFVAGAVVGGPAGYLFDRVVMDTLSWTWAGMAVSLVAGGAAGVAVGMFMPK
jgi:hypothetical protein